MTYRYIILHFSPYVKNKQSKQKYFLSNFLVGPTMPPFFHKKNKFISTGRWWRTLGMSKIGPTKQVPGGGHHSLGHRMWRWRDTRGLCQRPRTLPMDQRTDLGRIPHHNYHPVFTSNRHVFWRFTSKFSNVHSVYIISFTFVPHCEILQEISRR